MASRILIVDDSATLRKVVALILAKHGYETVTASDGQAGLDAVQQQQIDLVLLDFVMPRMNGYQFCRELRALNVGAQMPVVLMSAKAERIRDQFLQQTGAIDAITKPFDARALVAVVEGALERAAAGRVPAGAVDIPITLSDEALESATDSSTRISVSGRELQIAKAVIATLSPAIKDALGRGTVSADMIDDLIVSALTPGTIESLSGSLEQIAGSQTSEVALSGDIASIPLGEILQMLQMQRQTGVIEVTGRKAKVLICLRDGFIDLAIWKGESQEFRLGRYLADLGLATPEQLDIAASHGAKSQQLIGQALIDQGVVSRDDVRRTLGRQTCEIVYEALRWTKGRYLLLHQATMPEAEAAQLSIPIASIVMEGFRRVDEWRMIEESIHFDEVLVRNEAAIGTLRGGELTRQEQVVLSAVNGQASVREIIDATRLSSFDACKTLYRLLQSRLVRRQPAA